MDPSKDFSNIAKATAALEQLKPDDSAQVSALYIHFKRALGPDPPAREALRRLLKLDDDVADLIVAQQKKAQNKDNGDPSANKGITAEKDASKDAQREKPIIDNSTEAAGRAMNTSCTCPPSPYANGRYCSN